MEKGDSDGMNIEDLVASQRILVSVLNSSRSTVSLQRKKTPTIIFVHSIIIALYGHVW